MTDSGSIEGKIDQNMSKVVEPKWVYVNPDKNKKLGLIHSGNVNSILYNLLWDIISHDVNNDEARSHLKEVEWIMKRYPKDENRDDDTGVSNETIKKYLAKAKDIVKGMKQPVTEEVYVDKGKITKKSSDTAKKLNEDISEDMDTKGSTGYSYKKIHDNNGDHWQVLDPNGVLIATYESEEAAKNAVNGKKLNEEYDPFRDMIKSDSPEWHRGLYTDGKGSFYEAPREGTSKWIKKNNYKYRYDFGENEIQIADNSGDIIHSAYLSVGSWLDDPEYWYDIAMKELEDEEEEYLKQYYKEHPEDDKSNISVAELKDSDVLEEDKKDRIAEHNGYFVTKDDKRFNKYALYYQHPHSDSDGLIFLKDGKKLDDLLDDSIKRNKGAVEVVELAKKAESGEE